MHIRLHKFSAIGALASILILCTGCKNIECGDGTTERNGVCMPADDAIGSAKCGEFTELSSVDTCVPQFQPTVCDPDTTAEEIDPATHVITCVGTGGGGCAGGFACPMPAAGKQTICGQIYNIEDQSTFADPGAMGTKCMAGATSGPCALHINSYDAIAFGMNPNTATPLTTGPVYVDDCGRFRIPDITVPSGPAIGLGLDDADMTNAGPLGVTNAVGSATPKVAGSATKNFEVFIATRATTDAWAASGGPLISGGIFVAMFRAHHAGFDNQSGVTVTRANAQIPADDFYFLPAQTTRDTIDPTAIATGANGSGLVTNALVTDGLIYSGEGGGFPAECRWEAHAAASVPYVVFTQLFRPIDAVLQTCPL